MRTNIKQLVANVPVTDLEQALPLYQALAETSDVSRFGYRGLKMAFVGSFLLIEGNLANLVPQTATILVESIGPVLSALKDSGAEILEGPGEVPNGLRVQAQHPDGSVFEYLQSRRPPA
jgi:predicted enzyme related to lactoylglutathione lyase